MKRKIKKAVKSFSNFITIPSRIIISKKIISPNESTNILSSPSFLGLFSKNLISPHDFDKDYYLKTYPDVAAADIDPYYHFIHFGKAEGRKGSPYNLRKEVNPLCSTKETVLLISHDASRTGAPILALNIAQELKKQFNVVILLLNGGSITPFFEHACNSIISINREILTDSIFVDNLLDEVVQRYDIKYSIVNSIESFWVLQPLAKRFIPTVLLIHEFAAYTRPHNKFMESFLWAGTIVFPSKIVQENAINSHTENAIPLTYIISQGKSNIPGEVNNLEKKKHEVNIKSISLNNKQNHQSKPFIVLGAGSVHYRKGVDIFIATAAELKRAYPQYNIKLLWVGAGYNPEHDVSYSCYLAEQIQRSNLTDSFELIDEVPNLEELYEQTDVFYLSSRLDPLPNVVIDVMMLGKPIICFDKGTGAAEILAKDSCTAECIIPHLSVSESAKKIVHFYESTDYYSLVSSKIKALAQDHFDMSNYVTSLVSFFGDQAKLAKQEELDCLTLKSSDDFKEDYFSKPGANRQENIRKYVRSWHSKINLLRKPAPGFNQTIYDLHHHSREKYIEPFADYIRSGKPEGPWQEKMIKPKKNGALNEKKLRCAIHIHVFYADILQELMERIQSNKSVFDLYVSTNEQLFSEVSHILSCYQHINSRVRVVPNRGRDIGPLLTEFNNELQQYDVIGHFHTKKSLDLKNAQFARTWFLFLVENLLGGQYRMADHILNEFKNNSDLGLVFADDPYLLDWGKNKPFANELAEQMKISNLPEHHFNFPVGTMFWARPEAIKPLFELHYSWEMYPEEPLPYDGSILHAIERLIPIVVAHQGFKQALTHISGITR